MLNITITVQIIEQIVVESTITVVDTIRNDSRVPKLWFQLAP